MAGHELLCVRRARTGDTEAVLTMIRELAEFENLLHRVTADPESLDQALFGDPPRVHALVAEVGGEAAGFVLYHPIYSTFIARPGLHVEDLFVRPPYRRRGIGRALFARVAREALADGCSRLEWTVLKWNERAIRFYQGLGGQELNDWHRFRLEGPELDQLANGA